MKELNKNEVENVNGGGVMLVLIICAPLIIAAMSVK